MQKKTKNKSGLNILLGKEDTKEKSKCIWGPREVTRPFGPLPVLSQASSQRIMGRLDRIFREGESPQVPGPPPQHTHLAQLVSKPRPIPSCQFIHPLMSCLGMPSWSPVFRYRWPNSCSLIADSVFRGPSHFIKVAHGKKFLLGLFCILANKKEALTGIIFVTKLLFLCLTFYIPQNTLKSRYV